MPKISFFAKSAEGTKAKDTRIMLFVLLAVIFVIRFLLMPDLNNITKLRAEKTAKTSELGQKKTQFFSVEELLKNPQKYEEEYVQAEKTFAALNEKINLLKSKLVNKEAVAEVLNYLTAGVNNDRIKFNLIRMEPLEAGEYFNELPIEMKLTCDFHSFLGYMYAIESMTTL
ncbi:MAG: type 4a pilus biogenesis protein PilO, partial [Candidatus Omnitrophica bacterium]|nr:type 4a pilus biogenesis protein PilO [Candidatus Omnitrophota bacterium]